MERTSSCRTGNIKSASMSSSSDSESTSDLEQGRNISQDRRSSAVNSIQIGPGGPFLVNLESSATASEERELPQRKWEFKGRHIQMMGIGTSPPQTV
jgi:hypothetical protein